MKSGTSFLLAARQCEIAELEQLARTGELVGAVGRFVHALQRERGICNVFLSSRGRRFADQRLLQVAECEAIERQVRAQFDRLDTDAHRVRNGARLFNRVAVVLHALDALPPLRAQVAAQAIAPPACVAAFVKLLAGLLAVVFEAADSATDPQVSRALVALFNFMQGKEFAGQERAHGAAVFVSGAGRASAPHEWQHLIELQQGCFQVFAQLADPALVRAAQAGVAPATLAELERLRRIGAAATPQPPDTDLTQAWYDCCTVRIDAMRTVEDLLAAHLHQLCESRIAQARAELRDQRAMLEALAAVAGDGAPAGYGPHLERSVYAMLQEQSLRLQAMADELGAVRAALNERKVVERAKGLLMAHRNLREDEAYKALRQMAMNQGKRLVDVAEAVLALAEVLPGAR